MDELLLGMDAQGSPSAPGTANRKGSVATAGSGSWHSAADAQSQQNMNNTNNNTFGNYYYSSSGGGQSVCNDTSMVVDNSSTTESSSISISGFMGQVPPTKIPPQPSPVGPLTAGVKQEPKLVLKIMDFTPAQDHVQGGGTKVLIILAREIPATLQGNAIHVSLDSFFSGCIVRSNLLLTRWDSM